MLVEQFKKERNEALSSLDENKIRAFFRKWNQIEMPTNYHVFWGAVHKAITGCKDLPVDVRKKSKEWLVNNKLRSFDDGDLC